MSGFNCSPKIKNLNPREDGQVTEARDKEYLRMPTSGNYLAAEPDGNEASKRDVERVVSQCNATFNN